MLASLAYLDTVLPAGSHVAFLGLVDGRVLFNTTHDQIHPLGVPYPNGEGRATTSTAAHSLG